MKKLLFGIIFYLQIFAFSSEQFGLEIELQVETFSKIVQYFTFDAEHRTDSPLTKAKKVFNHPGTMNSLKLRADAPKDIKEFFSRFEWEEDVPNLEFRKKGTYLNADELVRDLDRFHTLIHPEGEKPEWRNPGKRNGSGWFSVHIHMSNSRWGRGTKRLLETYNLLLCADYLAEGRGGNVFGRSLDLFGTSSRYLSNILKWGVLRMINDQRFEIRRFVLSPAEEMKRVQHFFNLDAATAQKEMLSMIKNKITLKEIKKLGSLKTMPRVRLRLFLQNVYLKMLSEAPELIDGNFLELLWSLKEENLELPLQFYESFPKMKESLRRSFLNFFFEVRIKQYSPEITERFFVNNYELMTEEEKKQALDYLLSQHSIETFKKTSFYKKLKNDPSLHAVYKVKVASGGFLNRVKRAFSRCVNILSRIGGVTD